MLRFLSLVFVLSAVSSSAFAEGDEYWIIVSGDPNPIKAKELFEAHKRNWPHDVVTEDSYPKLVRSDRITGLTPGYTITVAGGCKDRKRAEKVRAALARTFRGTYVRKVTAYYFTPSTCPQLAGRQGQEIPEGFSIDKTVPVDGKKKLFWRVYSKPNSPCEGSSLLVRLVDSKRRVLDEVMEEAQCVSGDGDEDLGSQTGWTYDIVDGDPTSVEATGTSWAFDTPSEQSFSYKVADGRIKREEFDARERLRQLEEEEEKREREEEAKK
jgi:hypothetical protein